jgi:hypothetical protein
MMTDAGSTSNPMITWLRPRWMHKNSCRQCPRVIDAEQNMLKNKTYVFMTILKTTFLRYHGCGANVSVDIRLWGIDFETRDA